jgi:N-acetylglucosamine-6-phosphate deacetylase
MSVEYPWHAPSQERIVVRQHPGSEPCDIVVLEWQGEYFTGIRPPDGDERNMVADDPMIFATPGLFDIQINGYLGRGFKDADIGPEGIRDLCWSILLSGTTSFLPTITTDDAHTMRAAMANIDVACRAYPDVAAMIAGIHQEGPWISPSNGPRGAHRAQWVVSPRWEDFGALQAASGNRIRLLTVAPEVTGMMEFIRQVSAQGTIVSLGHHQATKETILRAIEAGARCVTHLGNGCAMVMPRHPNILWIQAAEDRLYADIISDGHHLPADTVKVLYRAKPRDRLILVSDAISMAGASPGLYHDSGGIAQMTQEGRYGFYGTQTLIGAAVPLAGCLANLALFAQEGKTPADYIAHATKVPAALLGISGIGASLGLPGTPATFVVWRWQHATPDLVPQRIVLRGRTVYDRETLPVQVPFGSSAQPATMAEAEHWLATQESV